MPRTAPRFPDAPRATDALPGTEAAHLGLPADPDGCYRALAAHDARFDGRFFTGVTSTGIYCRPVCRVRTPRRENCRFFALAAQAEQAGFRPCLRCRPELAPAAEADGAVWSVQDASALLAREAARQLDDPEIGWSADGDLGAPVLRLAERLGVSDRHLRRIFEAQFGVSPLQYLQTRRLLAAKQLLTDTTLPVAEVATASGFGSLRRFQAAFRHHYGLAPGQWRRGSTAADADGSLPIRLAWRPPYQAAAMLDFLRKRQIAGMETVVDAADGPRYRRTFALSTGSRLHAGWLQIGFDTARDQVLLQMSDALRPVLPAVIRRVRALLDLDTDPAAIDTLLLPHFPGTAGARVPGAMDGFELAVRAVLGQQITVAAARTLATRLVARFGAPLATPVPGLDRLFPSAVALAKANADALGGLGIVRQRQAAIVALAGAVEAGTLRLQPGAPPASAIAALCALPGIGDWTAQYIAMRALRWPDAFPAGDVALQKALGVRDDPRPAQAATEASQAWRPWRSYAVLRAWNTLGITTTESIAPSAGATGAGASK
ncbi:AlkA N-terminal domain-containing protein [uncultured Xylophilus sp.]|uniref:DNA-3-methyladenine glycosylase 2 family protein n=1 Tax=uncultured Xylophilus sp. TaxID=296832 RepID=UPI0025D82BE8|nr:AlkA N-terminal domain-containing protein [uncultured Xylophilus sp.]